MSFSPQTGTGRRASLQRPAFGACPASLSNAPAHLAALGLTPRECDVMQWVSEGKRDREIAVILGLSSRTVEKHVCHIFEKLSVETRTAAANHCYYVATQLAKTNRY